MKIGICLISYNRKAFTERAIESILLSNPDNLSVVIVDNNSTDGTQEMLLRYHTEKDIIKQVVYNDKNENSGYAINQAFEILSKDCDVMGSMPNDFVVTPGWDRNIKACIEESGFDYVIGAIRHEPKNINKTTPSGNGHYIDSRIPRACVFLKTEHWLNGFKMPTSPWCEERKFHDILKPLKGATLASPGLRAQKCEYTNPDYIEYYNKTFGDRGLSNELARRRKLEEQGLWGNKSFNWEEFLEKYYPNQKVDVEIEDIDDIDEIEDIEDVKDDPIKGYFYE